MKLRNVRYDLAAACVGALATLPQAVAYGLIAVGPLGPDWAVFGITASVGCAILFGFLSGLAGSNPVLISGPAAVTAVVLASGIQTALERGYGPHDAVFLAFLGLLVAGLFQMAAGLLRLGHAVSYIPLPVLSGFVNASALIVFLSALPTILGLPEQSVGALFASGFRAVEPWAVAVGGITILVTLATERRFTMVPAALVGLMTGTAAYMAGHHLFGLPASPMVGDIDILALWRVPPLLAPGLDWAAAWREIDIPLLGGASVGLLASFNTVVASSALSDRTSARIDANRDLLTHGLLNAAMGLLGFLPGSGAISRSTVMIEAGARTRAANAGTGIAFGLMLAGLAPLVAALPLWATAGMLVATAVQAVDRPTVRKIWGLLSCRIAYPRVVAGDVAITLAVVVTALVFDLVAAVGAGVLLAAALFVLGMGRNPVRRVYRGSRVHSKIQRPAAQTQWLEKEGHRIAVMELQGALFFGSCARLQGDARALLDDGVEYLVLDCRHLSSIDSTGSAALRALHIMFAETGGRVFVSYVEPERRKNPTGWKANGKDDLLRCRRIAVAPRWIWLNLEANGVVYALGRGRFFDDTDGALVACEERLLTRFGHADTPESRGVIASSALFSGLPREAILRLGRQVKRHRFRNGETVFRQGAEGDQAYFLVFGRMDVLIDIPGTARRKRVSALTEGTLFGEVGLIDRAPRSASVVATRDSTCFSIDADNFETLRAERPDLVAVLLLNLSRLFAARLRTANIMISELEQ